MAEHVEFNGKKYFLSGGRYYSTNKKHTALHRDIWEYYHGTIPEGYDVHHIDGDPLNNALENLQCLPHAEHLRIHTTRRRQAGNFQAKHERNIPVICAQCGKEFLACQRGAKFCSPTCNQKWQREHGRRHVEKTCAWCGKVFLSPKDTSARYCSATCAAIGNGTAKLSEEQVIFIRNNPDKLTQKQLAEKFNVTTTTISYIQLGKVYADFGGKIRGKLQGGVPRVPDDIRVAIRNEFIKGDRKYGARALAKKYGVDKKTVLNIVNEN